MGRAAGVNIVSESSRTKPRHKVSQSLADLSWRIFLEVMQAPHRDFPLVGERAAEISQPAGEARSGVTIDEQLRQMIACGEPARTFVDNGHDIRGLPVDRQFARPYQGGQPPLTVAIWSPVGLHLFVAQLADDATRKNDFDEH